MYWKFHTSGLIILLFLPPVGSDANDSAISSHRLKVWTSCSKTSDPLFSAAAAAETCLISHHACHRWLQRKRWMFQGDIDVVTARVRMMSTDSPKAIFWLPELSNGDIRTVTRLVTAFDAVFVNSESSVSISLTVCRADKSLTVF